MPSEFLKGLTNSQHKKVMYISKERNKLEDRHLHVNHSTLHRVCFLIPDYDGVYKQRWWNNATLLHTHTLLPWGITWSVYPRYFFNCGRTRLYPGATYFHPWWAQGVSMRQRRGFAATWWVHSFRRYCIIWQNYTSFHLSFFRLKFLHFSVPTALLCNGLCHAHFSWYFPQ